MKHQAVAASRPHSALSLLDRWQSGRAQFAGSAMCLTGNWDGEKTGHTVRTRVQIKQAGWQETILNFLAKNSEFSHGFWLHVGLEIKKSLYSSDGMLLSTWQSKDRCRTRVEWRYLFQSQMETDKLLDMKTWSLKMCLYDQKLVPSHSCTPARQTTL